MAQDVNTDSPNQFAKLGTVSQLVDDLLPLSGGTLTGDTTGTKFFRSSTDASYQDNCLTAEEDPNQSVTTLKEFVSDSMMGGKVEVYRNRHTSLQEYVELKL